ncbi:MAG: rhodanese-like domain-containing protein [Desulfobulbaceae bacterium]|nr:rhodanese-like domain-containing protein [Desulfobulbaceae bacterium]
MNWTKLFSPGKDFSVTEAKEYMAAHEAETYQLLDVRQPKEYETGHLAGSLLIPLKELPDRLNELDREKPIIVYCAVGGRSKVAAQLLSGHDFANVFNMSGGIKAWQGEQATGSEIAGLETFTGLEEYSDGVSLAYAMESGLQDFYRTLAERTSKPEDRNLYTRLMGFEDKHKAKLLAEYRRVHGQGAVPNSGAGTIEGGGKAENLFAQAETELYGTQAILQFSMALETQALDLYSRMARKSEQDELKELFLQLAAEEKIHLSWLSDEVDKNIQ